MGNNGENIKKLIRNRTTNHDSSSLVDSDIDNSWEEIDDARIVKNRLDLKHDPRLINNDIMKLLERRIVPSDREFFQSSKQKIIKGNHTIQKSNPSFKNILNHNSVLSDSLVLPDFQVNENAGWAQQYDCDVAITSTGDFVITWEDYRNGNLHIYAQRYSSSGVAQGVNFLVNDDSTTNHYSPSIAMDESGNFVITWDGNYDISAQRYNSNGVAQGNNFKVNEEGGTGSSGEAKPSIVMDGSGNFVITWMDYQNGNWDIYAQRYNSSSVAQGSNFSVNEDVGTGEHYYPSIAMDRSGDFVITWQGKSNETWFIYAQRFNNNGVAQGENFLVHDDLEYSNHYKPTIAMNESGNFVITWYDYRTLSREIYVQRYDSSGTAQGENFRVSTNAGYSPTIAMDGSGNFVITWYDYWLGDMRIYAMRYNSSGFSQGDKILINGGILKEQKWPSIAMDESGNFIITWQFIQNENWEIYAKQYNSSGVGQGTNFLVNDDQEGGSSQNVPSIASNRSGDFVIAWYDHRNGNANIYAQRYDSNGVAQDSNFPVSYNGGTDTQLAPAIAMDESGNFVITWYDYKNGNADIYAQRFNDSGDAQGANFLVNYNGESSEQNYPSIAMDGNGNFVISWEDYRNGNWDIYAQLFNNSGIAQGFNFKVNKDGNSSNQYIPMVAMDESGNFVITWEDYRNGSADIYAQLFNNSGVAQGSNFKVNKEGDFDYQNIPMIAMDESGNFVIVWRDWNIYAQRFNSSGIAQGSNFMVNEYFESRQQQNPTIAMDESGNFVILWEKSSILKGRGFYMDGSPVGGSFQINQDQGNAASYWPKSILSNGLLISTWQTNRVPGQGWDIFANAYRIESFSPDTIAPTIVRLTSTTSNGSYKIGDQINITVNFSEPVTLSDGNLVITLETGATDRTVAISSISNVTFSSGTYTVQAGDSSSDLSVTSIALSTGATLKDTVGKTMTDFSIPSGQNLNDNKDIVVDVIAPSIPIGLTAAPGNTQITLNWNKNDESDVTKYRIYGGTSTIPTTKVDSTSSVSDTTKTITGLINGNIYYYRITALDSAGNESEYSNEVSETPIGLVAHYPFNGNASDESGNMNDGTVYGAIPTLDRFGNNSSAYSFDGLDDYIESSNNAIINNIGKSNSSWSYSLFFSSPSTPSQELTLLTNYHSTVGADRQFSISLHEDIDGLVFGYIRSTEEEYSVRSNNILSDGKSHHIAWVANKDSSKIYLYVDNIMNGEKSYNKTIDYSGSNTLYIGAHFWDNQFKGYFKGVIDDIRIYNSALTVSEITTLYYGGPPSAPINISAEAGDGQTTLSWKANSESDFSRYLIYGGTTTSPTVVMDSTTNIDDTTKVIMGLTNYSTYYFRVTATDSAGNESDFSDEVKAMPIDLTPPTVSISNPIGNTQYGTEDTLQINWSALDNWYLTWAKVYFDYGLGGSTISLDSLDAQIGTYYWAIPDTIVSSNCRVIISVSDSVNHTATDTSTGSFTIFDNTGPVIALTSPISSDSIPEYNILNVNWQASDNIGVDSVKIYYSRDGSATDTLMGSVPGDSTEYFFNVPTGVTDSAQIKLIALDINENMYADYSDFFSVTDNTPPTILLEIPHAGDTLYIGSSTNIKWIPTDNVAVIGVDIYYSIDSGSTWRVVTTGAENDSTYRWEVPNEPSDQVGLQIIGYDGVGLSDTSIVSDLTIQITYPMVVSVSPESGNMTWRDKQIEVIFSQSMDSDQLNAENIVLKSFHTENILFTYTYIDSIQSLYINSSTAFATLDTITVSLNANMITSIYGYQLDGDGDQVGGDDYNIGYTTSMLADYDTSNSITGADLAIFVDSWNNDNLWNELGPISGIAPHFISDLDGVYDIEDLMAFILSGNWWLTKDGGLFRLLAKMGTDINIELTQDSLSIKIPDGTIAYDLQLRYNNQQLVIGEPSVKSNIQISRLNPETGLYELMSAVNDQKKLTLPISTSEKKAYLDLSFRAFGKGGRIIGQVTESLEIEGIPGEFSLGYNYPNPFNPVTTIQYGLPIDSRVQLTIYDILGREIRVLIDMDQKPGYHEVLWNGLDEIGKRVGSGLYLYVISANSIEGSKHFRKVEKMILLK